MKVGDLVRLKAPPSRLGLIVSIKRRPGFYAGDRARVQWFGTGRTYWVLEESLEKVSD